MDVVELTERQMAVYCGIQARKTPRQIATELGVSPQRVAAIRATLRDLGLIRQLQDLPAHGRYTEQYPWVAVSEHDPIPKLRLRLEHPQASSRDLTVATIRHVMWAVWSVQGLPMVRPDGVRAHEGLPDQRVVLITNLEAGAQWAFPASTSRPWLESDTLTMWREFVTEDDRRAMTLVIATAIGVESVFDLTDVRERTQ